VDLKTLNAATQIDLSILIIANGRKGKSRVIYTEVFPELVGVGSLVR
jgi:hypothetical protein